jgi:hypothetical protein
MRSGVPGMRTSMPRNGLKANRPLNRGLVAWRTAVVAGICAGVIATAVQLVLWWITGYPLPETLYRDARLAAAIVMGPDVLPPPATFELGIMFVATILHFGLSIIYSFVLVYAIRALASGAVAGLLAGLAFGLVLYVINMYGFTFLFPWFSLVRDWITVVAHLVFGLVLASTYLVLAARDAR